MGNGYVLYCRVFVGVAFYKNLLCKATTSQLSSLENVNTLLQILVFYLSFNNIPQNPVHVLMVCIGRHGGHDGVQCLLEI